MRRVVRGKTPKPSTLAEGERKGGNLSCDQEGIDDRVGSIGIRPGGKVSTLKSKGKKKKKNLHLRVMGKKNSGASRKGNSQ